MRILFCNYEYPPLGGGGGIITALLAAELAARRHEITVLTSQGLRSRTPRGARGGRVSWLRPACFGARACST